MHTHITLVGGQTYPIYLGIKALNPDKIIFVHSDQTENEAKRIANEFTNKDSENICLDATDFKTINLAVEYLLRKVKNESTFEDTITLDVSSGTKAWTIAFLERYKSILPELEIIYVSQKNIVYNYTKSKEYDVDSTIDLDLILRLNGTKIPNYIAFSNYTQEDVEVVKQIEKLRRSAYKSFNSLTIIKDNEKDKDRKYELVHKNSAVWENKGYKVSWDKVNSTISYELTTNKGDIVTGTLSSPHVIQLFFNTGWFEFKIANLLNRWSRTKEIRMNVVFPTTKGKDDNEVDILINAKEKILFVECKTQVTKPTDVDKFRTVAKNFGGLASMALFITDAPMNPVALEKCKKYGIMSFSIELAKDNKQRSIEDQLFEMLEKKINETNTR